MTDLIDHLVLGAGATGLHAALRLLREHPEASVRVIDAAARPGGSIQTQRSNGFSCELGAFAFARDEVEPTLALLSRGPVLVDGRCRGGWLFDGTEMQPVAVDPIPVSFASGSEELVQACRHELGDRLWLGREVTTVEPIDAGWQVVLAGEVPTTLAARTLVVCLPLATTAAMLAGYDPALAEIAMHLSHEPHAFVFLGGLASECHELAGYGIVPAPSVSTTVVESIYCSNVFARRCLADRFLLRSELAGAVVNDADVGDNAALIAVAREELQRWTGCTADFGFTKVHRITSVARDGIWAECQGRLHGLAARIANLQFG